MSSWSHCHVLLEMKGYLTFHLALLNKRTLELDYWLLEAFINGYSLPAIKRLIWTLLVSYSDDNKEFGSWCRKIVIPNSILTEYVLLRLIRRQLWDCLNICQVKLLSGFTKQVTTIKSEHPNISPVLECAIYIYIYIYVSFLQFESYDVINWPSHERSGKVV